MGLTQIGETGFGSIWIERVETKKGLITFGMSLVDYSALELVRRTVSQMARVASSHSSLDQLIVKVDDNDVIGTARHGFISHLAVDVLRALQHSAEHALPRLKVVEPVGAKEKPRYVNRSHF